MELHKTRFESLKLDNDRVYKLIKNLPLGEKASMLRWLNERSADFEALCESAFAKNGHKFDATKLMVGEF